MGSGEFDPPTEKGNFERLSCALKIIGSLCCSVRSKRDHSVLSSGTTCDAAFLSKFFDYLLLWLLCALAVTMVRRGVT